jgi:hypothetical protein
VWVAASVGLAAGGAYLVSSGRDALHEARTFFTAGRRRA